MPDDLTGLPPQPVDDGGSLDDHEAQWGAEGTGAPIETESSTETEAPDAGETVDPAVEAPAGPRAGEAEPDAVSDVSDVPRDDAGRFTRTRQPARKDQAGPRDVPRIQALAAEVKALKAEKAAWQAQQTSAAPSVTPPVTPTPVPGHPPAPPVQPQPPPASPPAAPTLPPTRPKPTEAQIGDTYPTYADFTEDLADWKYEQREAQRAWSQAQQTRAQTEDGWQASFLQQQAAIRATEPDYDAMIASVAHIGLSDVMRDAIRSSTRGAAITSWLARHPREYSQLVQDSLAVNTYAAVPLVRSVLEATLPVAAVPRPAAGAGMTGSTPPPVRTPAPRPPNPVRTGPSKPGDDPPDDDSSLDAHESFYYQSRR